MTDREAMIAAIAASPADDLPRLVFADWLDDHDEPALAEFIRAHVRLYRTRPGTGEHAAIARRCDDLIRANCGVWLKECCKGFGIPPPQFAPQSLLSWLAGSKSRLRSADLSETILHTSPRDYIFELQQGRHWNIPRVLLHLTRGLVTRVRVLLGPGSPPNEAARIALAFRSTPITALEADVADGTQQWEHYSGPHLGSIRALSTIHTCYFRQLSWPSEELYSSIFHDPHLTAVTFVRINHGPELQEPGFSGQSLGALNNSPLVHRLHVLRLMLSSEVVETLGSTPPRIPLQEIDFTYLTPVSPDTWSLLPTIPLRETLRRLSLKSCRLTDEAMLAITRVRRWDKLTHLRLDQNQIADRGVAGMCRTCVFPEVRFLNLSDNQIGDLGAVAIGRSGIAQTVHFLDLTKNRITATGAIPLAAGLAEGPLKLLKLTARPLGRRTVRRISEMLGNRVRYE